MSQRLGLQPNYLPEERALLVDLPSTYRVASWALCKGGLVRADSVVWCEVKNAELSLEVDAVQLLQQRLERVARPLAVGLLTSANIERFRYAQAQIGELSVECVVTAGFGNALAVGDPPTHAKVGTINVLCVLSAALNQAGLLEALSIITEARTVAVSRRELKSTVSQERASGTGTDCIVVACPSTTPAEQFSGKHTTIGHLLGKVVLDTLSP